MDRERMRVYLEYQADRVEAILAAHRAPCRVREGSTGPRKIKFFLELVPHVRLANVKRLADDLALGLQVPTCVVERGKTGAVLVFDNPYPRPVGLVSLVREVDTLPACSGLLGERDDGQGVFVRLSGAGAAQLLVSGTTGSGKSTLLRCLAASLACFNRPDVLQLVLISPKRETFEVFEGLRHVIAVVSDVGAATDVVAGLAALVKARDAAGTVPGVDTPRVVLVIDELADLVQEDSKRMKESVTQIVGRGRGAGVHVVAATQHPKAAILGALMRANFPLRLVGKVVSADDARVAAGRGGTNAHLLGGAGAFLAVVPSGLNVRFQVPWVTDDAIQELLSAQYGAFEKVAIPDGGGVYSEKRDRVQEAVDVLRPEWPRLRIPWRKGKRVKSTAVRRVWPEAKRYEGSFAGWIEEAVERLEMEHLAKAALVGGADSSFGLMCKEVGGEDNRVG